MSGATTVSREQCPLCGARQRTPLFAKGEWPIARCDECRLVFVDARVDGETVERLYGRGYYEGEAFEDYVGEREVRIASARDRVAALGRLVPSGSLLDVGCAAGYFLEAAAARYAVTGVEVSAYASQLARETFGHRVFTGDVRDAPLRDDEFDVVTMWDVIEHLAAPRETLLEIARVTRPGGRLVVTTGDASGPLARRDLEHWDLMHPPGHLLFFTPRTLETLLNRTGFEVERIVGDGRLSDRRRLQTGPLRSVAAALGVGNVMTVIARRTPAPRRRVLASRLPTPLQSVRAVGRRRTERPDPQAWLDIATASAQATFFHTPMWRELAVDGVGSCRDQSFLMTLPSGVRAVFPLQELLPRHGRGRYLHSTYPYGYGGPIADGTLTRQDLHALYARARAAEAHVTGNPLVERRPPPPGWERDDATTQMIDLSPGYATVRRGFSKGHRAAITQATRIGVTTRIADSIEDYRAYYRVYEDSLRRWGSAASPRYPWSLFEVGHAIARRHPSTLRLWLAEYEGEVVSGAWVLAFNGHAVYWHAATLERAFSQRPANLVVAAAIEDACGRGDRRFDFGSSGGHGGPESFKRRFGAVEHPLAGLRYVTPALRVTGALRRRVASNGAG